MDQLKAARYGLTYVQPSKPWPIDDSQLGCEYNCWYSINKLLHLVSSAEQMAIKLSLLHQTLHLDTVIPANLQRAMATKYAFWPLTDIIQHEDIVSYREFTGPGHDIHEALQYAHLPLPRLVPQEAMI